MSDNLVFNTVYISTDGNITTYDKDMIQIPELSGNLTLLKVILEINRKSSKDKRDLPEAFRVKHCRFYIVNYKSGEEMFIETSHVIAISRFIKDINVEEKLQSLHLFKDGN